MFDAVAEVRRLYECFDDLLRDNAAAHREREEALGLASQRALLLLEAEDEISRLRNPELGSTGHGAPSPAGHPTAGAEQSSPAPGAGEWAYSHNEESYHRADGLADAVNDLARGIADELLGDEPYTTVRWVSTLREFRHEDLVTVDVDWVLDHLRERACDEVGDFGDEYPDLAKGDEAELERRLEKTLLAFLDEYVEQPRFFQADEVYPVRITLDPSDGSWSSEDGSGKGHAWLSLVGRTDGSPPRHVCPAGCACECHRTDIEHPAPHLPTCIYHPTLEHLIHAEDELP
jgi:hypothetical protein